MREIKIGMDIITPEGWGEVVEIFKNDSFLVEFPNKRRKIYFNKDLKGGIR
jgi:hypothetical protein